MLEFILRKEDDFIVGLIFLFLSIALGNLVPALFAKKEKRRSAPVTLKQIIYIDGSQTNNYYGGGGKGSSDDMSPVVSFVIVASCLGYVYWRQEILLTITSISLCSIGLLIGVAMYVYAKEVIDGAEWKMYLIFTSAIAVLSLILIGSALKPVYAPDGLDSFQTIFKQQKLVGLIKALSLNTATWLLTHVAGVFVLFMMQIRLSLSLGHYLAIVHLRTAEEPSSMLSWFASRTTKYKSPFRNGVILSMMCVASYVLINGYAYVWYTDFMSHRPV